MRFSGRCVRGFALGEDTSVDALVAAKLAEGGYPNVAAYQKAKGLPVDGVAGHDTLVAMGYGYLYDLAGRGLLKAGQTQLDTKRTPLTPEQAAQALSVGYQTVTGSVPTPEVLALLIAQTGHETTNWKDISNYAFGGVKDFGNNPYVQALLTGEGNPPKHYVLPFAAYRTPEEGATAYIRTLKARPPWWAGLQSGNPETFVAALRSIPHRAYFTGNTRDYLTSVQSRAAQFADLARAYARQLAPGAVLTPYVLWPAMPPRRALHAPTSSSREHTIFVLSAVAVATAAGYAVYRWQSPRNLRFAAI